MITQVINVNEILKQALLFDFYGELLTDHQKEIYGQFIQEDLSIRGSLPWGDCKGCRYQQTGST